MKGYKTFIASLFLIAGFSAFGQPNSVSTDAVSSITNNAANLQGTIVTGPFKGNITYFFKYGTDNTLTTFSSTTSEVVNGGLTGSTFNVDSDLTGLTPESEYAYLLNASEGGSTVEGSINSFWTLSNVLTTAVADFKVRSNGTSNIHLEWTAASTTVSDGYLIIYQAGATAPDPSALQQGVNVAGQSIPSATIIDVSGSTSIDEDITGLIGATQYSFVIIPYNSDGTNEETFHYNNSTYASLSAFTLYPEPSVNAGAASITSSTSSSITLEFSKSNGAVPADGYFISYRKSGSNPNNPSAIDGTAGTSQTAAANTDGIFSVFSTAATISTEITGLEAATEYSFRILAFSGNTGMDSTSYNYKTNGTTINSLFTLATPPTTSVSNFQKTGAIADQIDFSFDPYSFPDNGGFVMYYQAGALAPDLSGVQNALDPDNQTTAPNFFNWTATDAATSISTDGDINAGSQYTFVIIPYNSDGSQEKTIHYRKTSPATLTAWSRSSNPSGAVASLTLNNPTANSFDVTYPTVTADGYLAVYGTSTFDVTDIVDQLSPASQTVANATIIDLGNVTTETITGLVANTEYEVSIVPYNVALDGGNPVDETYNYRTGGALVETISTICTAPTNQASFSTTDKSASTIELNWSDVADADRYLILARAGADPDFTPINGDSYVGNSNFSSATTVGTATKIVYVGAVPTLPLTISALDPNTEYRFFIYAFNDTDNCYNTNAPGTATIITNNPSNNNILSINSEAATIDAVLNDASGSFVTAFSFNITDEGLDVVDTHLSSIIISAGASDYFATNGIDWLDIIDNAQLVNTTTTGNETRPLSIAAIGNNLSIAIPNNDNDEADDFGFIADNSQVSFELQIKIKDNITVAQIDNKHFSFEINPANITTEGVSSGFDNTAGTTITTEPTNNKLEVTTTKFAFTTQPPATINAGEDMVPQAVFEARDANENVDLDFSSSFVITNADNIPMNNAPTTGFVNGVHTFPANFNYQGSGDGTLTVTSGASTASSTAVNVLPTVSYTTISNGLNAGELDGGSTNQAVGGIAITALGSINLNELVLHQNLTIANKIENLRFFLSANDTYEGIGSETAISATVSIDNGVAKTITFDAFSESINTTTKYFFVVADVANTVNEFDTPNLTLSIDQSDFTYSSAINNASFSASFIYSFNDVIAPTVSAVVAEYPVISDSDNSFTLSISFNEEMDNTINPTISFPVASPATTLSINNAASNWSAGNTVFNAVYDVTDINIDVSNISVNVSDARDKSLNLQTIKTTADVFSVDTENPTVVLSLNNSLINVANLTTTLTATFIEPMNPATLPIFTINGTTNMVQSGAGAWSAANTIYTQQFTHNGSQEEINTNSIEVTTATDIYGNIMVTKSTANYAIDTQPAKITTISSPSGDGLYGPSEVVVIELTFDDNVVVSGSPKLLLNTTGAEASFASFSANKVRFNYQVGAVGSGQNVLDLNVNSVSLNGGAIKDLNTNNVNIAIPNSPNNLADNADITIDTKAAVITMVSSLTADGFYNEGEVIQLLISFDEAVSVSGNPTLALTLDAGATASAIYVGAQSVQSLIFEYTVSAGENTEDLGYANTNALSLAGGSIQDAAGIASSLTLPIVGSANSLSGSSDIVIDTENPTLTIEAFKPANDSLNVSHINEFKIEFTEQVLGAGTNNIRLVRLSDDQIVKSFDADTLFRNSEAITLLTKSLAPFIADTTVYYFEFDAGAIVDRAGNPFAGFSGNSTWSFTSAGPSRIDSYSEGACVGEEFIIKGEYFTGVTLIEIGAGAVTYEIGDFSVTENGDSILFLVKPNTASGVIKLTKEDGKSNNTETFSSTSSDDIFVGPSSAQIAITPVNICNDGFGGSPDVILFSVDVVGGSGTYSIVYNNGIEDIIVSGYENGTDMELVPPVKGTNIYSLVSVVDNDAILSSCGVPSNALGTSIEIEKYERSEVEAGGGTLDPESGYGVITVCIAEKDNVNLSEIAEVGTLPFIDGDVTTGQWSIVGGSGSSGGFNLAKTNKTSTQIKPTYYFSLDDVSRGEVILELTSDPPAGANPCAVAKDRVLIRFVSSSQANPVVSTVNICTEIINGNEVAITQVTAIKGGGATDVEWTRNQGANTDVFDGSWGFADSLNATVFTEKSTKLNPFYKASPSELSNDFATLYVKATAGNCGTSLADSVPLSINIKPLLSPTFSGQAGVNPLEVCSGASSVLFKVNPSSPNSSFSWQLTNSGVDALNQNNKNEITTSAVGGLYGNAIIIGFREVTTDAVETITVKELKEGCESESITFDVLIKANPTAEITSKPSSTINNSTTDFPLIGQGGYGTNLMSGGVFTGKGVTQKSDGSFILNTSNLSPTSVLDPNDDYKIIYTYTTGLGCSATDTASFDVFDQENSFPDLGAVYCEDDASFEITLDNAVLGTGFEVIDIFGPGTSEGVTFIEPDTTDVYKATINPALLLTDNAGNINITITYATRNTNSGDINLVAGSQSVIVNPLPETAAQPLNDAYCTSDGTIPLRRDETLNPNSSFQFSIINPELPADLNLLKVITSPKSFQLDLSVLPAYFQNTGTDSLNLKLRYTYTSDAGCINADTISTVIYKLPEQPIINADRFDYTFTIAEGAIIKKDTVEIENNTGLVTYWFAEEGSFNVNDALATGDKFSPNIDLNSLNENYFAVRQENGCFSITQEVNFYRQALPTFTWNSSIFDENTPIVFSANDNNEDNSDIEIISRNWEIIDQNGISLPVESQQQGFLELSYFFNEAGKYKVTYRATTNRGSTITTSNEVVVVPRVVSLYDDFNDVQNSWVSTGSNSSWEKAIPTENSGFVNDDAVWITNSDGNYAGQEKSYLYSAAYNIQNIDKPVASFNLWLDMTNGDGVRLEYSTDDKLIGAVDKVWLPLGADGSGLDWYNANDLGVEDIGFASGWTANLPLGITNAYNPRHDLLAIQGQSNGGSTVIFRFNFSSNSLNTKNGIAIDNFGIESLNRTRLIEYFGSISEIDYNQMQLIKNNYLGNDDIAFVNYRINENDPYFAEAVSDVTTRMNFYQAFDASNDFVLDGDYFAQSLISASSAQISNRVLVSSSYNLDVSQEAIDNKLSINVNVETVGGITFPNNMHLMVAVVNSELLLPNDSLLYNVLTAFLPTSQGTIIDKEGNYTFTYSPTSSTSAKNLKVVAFLQQFNQSGLPEVYQAAITNNMVDLKFQVTSVSSVYFGEIKAFPNPANQFVDVSTNILNTDGKILLFDMFGRQVLEQTINRGQQLFRLSTKTLATGMYQLCILDEAGHQANIKIVVKH